ncbi:hypothetical protein DFH29DRAFT_803461 [Suillus ampliporus]|nr:hypothetical protein DFH29DRAFT_803461 [Suillus ampliporus]
MMVDYGMDFEALPYTAPPGEEGLEFSHVGGEHEAFEGLAIQIAEINHRTCRDCTENQMAQWDIQIGHLVDAYLDYHSRSAENGMPTFDEPPMVLSSSDPQCLSLSNIKLVDLFRMYDGLHPAINTDLFSEQSHSSPQSLSSHKYPNKDPDLSWLHWVYTNVSHSCNILMHSCRLPPNSLNMSSFQHPSSMQSSVFSSWCKYMAHLVNYLMMGI